jgi:hypothetical protein
LLHSGSSTSKDVVVVVLDAETVSSPECCEYDVDASGLSRVVVVFGMGKGILKF